MDDLELDLEVAEVRLLKSQHHLVRQLRQLAEGGHFEEILSPEIAGGLVSIHLTVVQRVGHGLAGIGVDVGLLLQRGGEVGHGQRPVPVRNAVVETVLVQRVLCLISGDREQSVSAECINLSLPSCILFVVVSTESQSCILFVVVSTECTESLGKHTVRRCID